MRHEPIPPALFTENRARLRALLPPKSLVVAHANDVLPTNGDGTLGSVANSDLFWLTGVEQEESILVLAPDSHDPRQREILFLRETNSEIAQWEGHKLTQDEAREVTGIAEVRWLSEFPTVFRSLMCEHDLVWLNSNENRRAHVEMESRDARFIRWCQEHFPLHCYQRLARIMHRLRAVKSAQEIDLIKKAVAITKAGFDRVARFLKPGVSEHEIEAELAHEFVRSRASFAYRPIVASGANGCVLHYVSNDQPCQDGDLLLLDAAAAYANYNSDLTRTIPVNGVFTKRQRAVYGAVQRVMEASIASLRPGKLPREWQAEAEAMMQEELLALGLLRPRDVRSQKGTTAVKKYFMHGLGHPLGLDVHDVAAIGEPMAAGWVMTVEPGIYLPKEGYGIRLENDVLITEDGPVDLMADIALSPDEIEALMHQK